VPDVDSLDRMRLQTVAVLYNLQLFLHLVDEEMLLRERLSCFSRTLVKISEVICRIQVRQIFIWPGKGTNRT